MSFIVSEHLAAGGHDFAECVGKRHLIPQSPKLFFFGTWQATKALKNN